MIVRPAGEQEPIIETERGPQDAARNAIAGKAKLQARGPTAVEGERRLGLGTQVSSMPKAVLSSRSPNWPLGRMPGPSLSARERLYSNEPSRVNPFAGATPKRAAPKVPW
jgi:hypothetical protein